MCTQIMSNFLKIEQIVVIHEKEHYTDCKADIVIYDQPGKVLSNLGYDFEPGKCQNAVQSKPWSATEKQKKRHLPGDGNVRKAEIKVNYECIVFFDTKK